MMGMTANGCSTAPPEGPFTFTTDPERDCELKTLGTSAGGDSAYPGFRTWVDGEEEDAPNFETLTQACRSFSAESKVFRFTLHGFRDSVSNRAKSSPLVGLAAEARWERLSWWKEVKTSKQQNELTSSSKGQEYPT